MFFSYIHTEYGREVVCDGLDAIQDAFPVKALGPCIEKLGLGLVLGLASIEKQPRPCIGKTNFSKTK